MAMRSKTVAMRGLVYETAKALDISRYHTNEQTRVAAREFAEFMLPVCKTGAAEVGFEVANSAVQVFGGHGYVADHGVEQFVRDSRVMAIYEGTSGIQALDLVKRKLLKEDGIRYLRLRDRITGDIESMTVEPFKEALIDALALLDEAVAFLRAAEGESPADVEAGAYDFLHLVRVVASAWMWARMVEADHDRDDSPRQTIRLAEYYFQHVLIDAEGFAARVFAGAGPMLSINVASLAGEL